jgi:hypothetical protein
MTGRAGRIAAQPSARPAFRSRHHPAHGLDEVRRHLIQRSEEIALRASMDSSTEIDATLKVGH